MALRYPERALTFSRNRAVRAAEISDGLSQALCVGERSNSLVNGRGHATWAGAVPGAEFYSCSGRAPRPGATILARGPLVAESLLAGGCDPDAPPPDTSRRVITVAELPANVREAAAKALPGVTLEDAWQNVDVKTKALHSYEVRGRAQGGKVREVRVAADGTVLEME